MAGGQGAGVPAETESCGSLRREVAQLVPGPGEAGQEASPVDLVTETISLTLWSTVAVSVCCCSHVTVVQGVESRAPAVQGVEGSGRVRGG